MGNVLLHARDRFNLSIKSVSKPEWNIDTEAEGYITFKFNTLQFRLNRYIWSGHKQLKPISVVTSLQQYYSQTQTHTYTQSDTHTNTQIHIETCRYIQTHTHIFPIQ